MNVRPEKCMRALARRRGEHGEHVIRVLDQQPERLKTLHTLTEGNPLVLALIYRLLETAESDAAMADLEILLDQVTPYYKARIEEYQTPQQRAVIDAIALYWDPITTGHLSRITNVPSTTLSPLLIKLRKDGLIESLQQATERTRDLDLTPPPAARSAAREHVSRRPLACAAPALRCEEGSVSSVSSVSSVAAIRSVNPCDPWLRHQSAS